MSQTILHQGGIGWSWCTMGFMARIRNIHGICSFDGCGKGADDKARMLCVAHGAQARRGGPLRPLRGQHRNRYCRFPECGRGTKSLGLCAPHYQQFQKKGRDISRLVPLRDKANGDSGECHVCGGTGWDKYDGLCVRHGVAKSLRGAGVSHVLAKSQVCQFPGCPHPSGKHGVCNPHMVMFRRSSRLAPLDWQKNRDGFIKCEVAWCNNTTQPVRTLCPTHAQQARRYGLTHDLLSRLVSPNVCEGCGSSEELHVDHDHECCPKTPACGKCVRGLLCRRCNHALGLAGDNPEVLRGIALYVERFRR